MSCARCRRGQASRRQRTGCSRRRISSASCSTAWYSHRPQSPIPRASAVPACAAMPGLYSNEGRTAMTGSGRGVAPMRARRLGATAGGLLALMLTGCVDTTTAPWGVNLGDYQAPARDLVGVSLYTAEHVIRLGPGGTVSQTERNDLEAFLTAIAYNRPESARIVVHGRATPAQRSALTATLTVNGVGPEHILWARDGDLGRPVPRGTLVLATERAIAVAPNCPGFMGHPSAPTDNLTEPN